MTNNNQDNNKNSYVAPIAIIIAGLIIAGAIVYSNRTQSGLQEQAGDRPNPNQAVVAVNIKDVDIKNEPFIGDPKAPVTLVEWSDFQCPFCKRFDQQTLLALTDKYVKTGKLKVVFKDYPFLGPDSQTGVIASNAVWELYPKEYSQWIKEMLEAQDGENSGFGNKKSIIKLIKDKLPKIDADKVSKLMTKKQSEYKKEGLADKAEGLKFGIKGTPGFIIGTQMISGAQPVNVFSKIIEAELNKAK